MFDYILRLIVVLLLSSLVGLERERQDKPAGLRDVMLVGLGTTAFVIVSLQLAEVASQYASTVKYDIGRISAYVIASIGFLGSGAIIQHKGNTEGITTAAVLWTIVGVGLLCGLGDFILATVLAGMIYGILKLKYLTTRGIDDEVKQTN